MRALFVPLALVAMATPGYSAKVFKDTKEYREEQKGYLNVKFDTYAQMLKEPKGTDCDWVYVDSSYNLEEVRKQGVTLHVASIAVHEGFGFYAGLWGNPVLQSFESSLGNVGIRATRGTLDATQGTAAGFRPAGNQADQVAAAMREAYKQNPQAIEMMVDQKLSQSSVMDAQMDKDLYEEDKKNLGVAKAIELQNQRVADRRTKVRNQLLGISQPAPALPEAPKPASTAPEDQPGYQLVFYVTESKADVGVWVSTNSTTAEFILLKDGKPVLAARHNAASMGWGGGSGGKCGQALASALNVLVKKS